MNDVFVQILGYLNIFMLIFFRCIGLFIASPIFGRNNLPNIFKLTFCMLLSYILLPFISEPSIMNMPFLQMLFLSIKEFLVGITIGFIAFIVFSTFLFAGSFIDMDLGFSMANVIDPQYGGQVPLSGNFLYILATTIFLLLNGDHYLIKALINSYYLFPINKLANINGNFLTFLIKLIDYVMVSALKIAIPIMIAIFLINLILGILARTMPQMNVFAVGMPLKVIVGLGILSFVLPYYIPIYKEIFKEIYKLIFEILKIL